MNETFKLSGIGMQRSNIELERQRHLANWLVKSSPHMAAAAAVAATTTTASTPTTATTTTGTNNPGSTSLAHALTLFSLSGHGSLVTAATIEESATAVGQQLGCSTARCSFGR